MSSPSSQPPKIIAKANEQWQVAFLLTMTKFRSSNVSAGVAMLMKFVRLSIDLTNTKTSMCIAGHRSHWRTYLSRRFVILSCWRFNDFLVLIGGRQKALRIGTIQFDE